VTRELKQDDAQSSTEGDIEEYWSEEEKIQDSIDGE